MVSARSGDLMKPLLDQGGVAPNGQTFTGTYISETYSFLFAPEVGRQ